MLFEYFLGFFETGPLSLDNLVEIYYAFKLSNNTNVSATIAKRNVYKNFKFNTQRTARFIKTKCLLSNELHLPQLQYSRSKYKVQ